MRITDIKTFIPMVGHPPAMPGQGRDGRGHLRLGRIRAVGARGGGRGGGRPLPRAPHRRGPDGAAARIWQRLYRSQYFEGGRVLTARDVAIDIALHDICGKALGVPVYELLGGRQRDFVPLFATTPARHGPGARSRTAQLLVDAGLGRHPLLARRRRPRATRDRVRAARRARADRASGRSRLREAVGPGATSASTGTIGCRSPETASASARGCRPARSTSSRSRSAPRTPTPTSSCGG